MKYDQVARSLTGNLKAKLNFPSGPPKKEDYHLFLTPTPPGAVVYKEKRKYMQKKKSKHYMNSEDIKMTYSEDSLSGSSSPTFHRGMPDIKPAKGAADFPSSIEFLAAESLMMISNTIVTKKHPMLM